jgi:phosphopentomutase
LHIPHLCDFGIGNIVDLGCKPEEIIGCYGKMAEQSSSKDTTTGHWEIAGLVMDQPFPTYPDGFPKPLMRAFERKIGTKTLGNFPCSGTEILKELGNRHIETGYPIVYTSADSVFQIAAHKDIITVDKLYEFCKVARALLAGEHAVGRVIARPFTGASDQFERDNASRKDFSLKPPDETLLDVLTQEGIHVTGIGKIGDIFGRRGLTEEIHTDGNLDGIQKTVDAIGESRSRKGLIFVNLVDFDMVYGHRRNIEGYAGALEAFDRHLPQIMKRMSGDDALIITADHGCDPSYEVHTDHTREYVPILVFGKQIKNNIDLGTRDTFADCGQTISDLLGARPLKYGKSFKGSILDEPAGD